MLNTVRKFERNVVCIGHSFNLFNNSSNKILKKGGEIYTWRDLLFVFVAVDDGASEAP